MNITNCVNLTQNGGVQQFSFNIETDEAKYQANVWYSFEKGKFFDWEVFRQDGDDVSSAEEDEIIEYLDKNWDRLT
jgi:hypothetical protein